MRTQGKTIRIYTHHIYFEGVLIKSIDGMYAHFEQDNFKIFYHGLVAAFPYTYGIIVDPIFKTIDNSFSDEPEKSEQFTVEDMKECFKYSRLTHPLAGFKHDTFEDFMNWKNFVGGK